jgi:predicted RNase H-like HicB family nuclease
MSKPPFKVTIIKEDGYYKARVDDYPHIHTISANFDLVKTKIKECIEVWTDVKSPKIIFNVK